MIRIIQALVIISLQLPRISKQFRRKAFSLNVGINQIYYKSQLFLPVIRYTVSRLLVFSKLCLFWTKQYSPSPTTILKYTNYIIQKANMESRRGWSEIEDDRLLKIIKKYGTKNWSLISQKLSIGTTFERTGKQCRERWYNHLNPQINNDNWTKEEDQKLFQAHRKQGSKWKEISKLFSGRTDNSIKNHFYSTVRKCLRTISKLKGERNTTITMKSIKPYVLSKIVQNTQLTNLIVMLGRSKSKDSTNLNINPSVVDQISSQLKRISAQYSQKNNQGLQLTNKRAQSIKSKSLNSFSPQRKDIQIYQFPSINDTVKHYHPQDEPMKQYFEEFQSHPNLRTQFVLEANHWNKQRGETHLKDLFATSHHPQSHTSLQFRSDSLFKIPHLQRQLNDESCAFEQFQSNFFMSPRSTRKQHFPDIRLLGTVSRNSIPSPRRDDRFLNEVINKMSHFRQQPIEIQFDAHDFLNEQQGRIKKI